MRALWPHDALESYMRDRRCNVLRPVPMVQLALQLTGRWRSCHYRMMTWGQPSVCVPSRRAIYRRTRSLHYTLHQQWETGRTFDAAAWAALLYMCVWTADVWAVSTIHCVLHAYAHSQH